MQGFFNPRDWYWAVAGDTTEVYSSARNLYVAVADPAYLDWLANNVRPTPIDAESSIWYYLQDWRPSWLFDGATFAQPAADSYTKAQLSAYAAAKRYDKEVGGTTVNGHAYLSDRETQAKLTAAVLLCQVNPSATIKWKLADGSFIDLDAAGMTAVASAVGAFVQACFATEASVTAAIAAGTTTTLAQVDAAFAS